MEDNTMILELVKRASTKGLSTIIDCKDNVLSIALENKDYERVYSFEAKDYIEVYTNVANYLINPTEFTKKKLSNETMLEVKV